MNKKIRSMLKPYISHSAYGTKLTIVGKLINKYIWGVKERFRPSKFMNGKFPFIYKIVSIPTRLYDKYMFTKAGNWNIPKWSASTDYEVIHFAELKSKHLK